MSLKAAMQVRETARTPVVVGLCVMLVLRGVEPAWWFGVDVKPLLTSLLFALAAFAVT